MTSTGLIICTDALIAAGILGNADPISPEASSLALRLLNQMLDSWNTDRDMIYTVQSDTFTMVTGQQTYSSTSLLSGLRPIKVDSCIVSLSNIDYDVDIIDTKSFQDISYKPVNSIPEVMSITQSYPAMSFDFWPRPYAAFVCTMQVYTPLPTTIAENTVVALPPGYEDAIVTNLAVKCAPRWGRQIDPGLRLDAANARKALMRMNYEPDLLDSGVGGSAGQISNGMIYQGWR